MNGDASKECERGWRPPERSKQGGEALLRGNQSRSARRVLSRVDDRGADSVHGIDRDLARSRDAAEGDGGNLFGVFLAARLDQTNRESDLTPKESSGNLPGAAKRFREVRGGHRATITPSAERAGHALQVFVCMQTPLVSLAGAFGDSGAFGASVPWAWPRLCSSHHAS